MTENDQDIEQLLTAAGQRRPPPEDMRARVYAHTLAAWEALPARPSRPSQKVPWLALAATVLIAVTAASFWFRAPLNVTPELAEVTFVRGTLHADNGEVASRGRLLEAGSVLMTPADGMASIRFRTGARVVLDVSSRVVIGSNAVELEAGRVYVDADGAARLTVVTPEFEVRDIGTQFEVGVGPAGSAWVALREGRVDVQSADHRVSMMARDGVGELARFEGTALARREALTSTDVRWQWQREGRAPLQLDGTSVYEYLHWMARDTGHQLQFASRAVEQRARLEYLQGAGTSDETTMEDALRTARFKLTAAGTRGWLVDFL